jgi:hypothetical protein
MVAEQIIGMIENNILAENGMEAFVGWIEDGDTFYVSYEDANTEEQIKEAIKLAREIANDLDSVLWKLALENED